MTKTRTYSHFDLGTEGAMRDVANNGSAFPMPAAPNTPAPTMEVVSRELAGIKSNLGFIDQFILDRRINKEAKRVLAEGYLQLIEAKKQELIAKITIGLAESKKIMLVESLRVSGEIDREISDLSARFASTMFDGALAANFAAAQEEHRKLQEVEATFKAGQITEARYLQLREATVEAADHVTSIVKHNVGQIIQAHVGQIKLALELFRERVLNKGF